jgi:dienelactone hydrolase
MTVKLLLLLLGASLTTMVSAQERQTPARKASMPWNMKELSVPPKSYPAPEYQAQGVQAVFYDGVPWRGKPTRVFAWYGIPEGLKAGEKVPAMVLVHGGGGTAFAEWVRLWTKRGYVAIAMDTCGVAPNQDPNARPRHADGGPPGWGDFDNADAPITEQWTYHAISAIILGHSFLRTLPEVDASRVGITGISWGGYLTSIAASVDPRFRLAVPVYGCGFLGDNSVWLPEFSRIGTEKAARWLEYWDPSSYLANSKTPFLWVNGTNDFAYPMDSWQKSYRRAKGKRLLSLQIRMPHGHGGAGENPEEIHAFANAILNKGRPIPRFVSQNIEDKTLHAKFEAKIAIQRVEICFTRDKGAWQQRHWESSPAEFTPNGTVTATIPTGATVFYLNLVDAEGHIWSSEHIESP